jgi:hypothetical protein
MWPFLANPTTANHLTPTFNTAYSPHLIYRSHQPVLAFILVIMNIYISTETIVDESMLIRQTYCHIYSGTGHELRVPSVTQTRNSRPYQARALLVWQAFSLIAVNSQSRVARSEPPLLANPTTKMTPQCGVIAAPLPHSTRYARMEALYSTVDS